MMGRKIIKIWHWILLGCVLVLSSSCTVERQLAQGFLQDWKPPAIMLIPPPIVLKENLKAVELPEHSHDNQIDTDSLLFEQSLFLKELEDSLFLERYVNAMINSLRAQGYIVYTPSAIDTFLTIKGEAYILDMAQVLIEELEDPVTEKEVFDEAVYYKKFSLNAIQISSWFELSQMNVPEADRKVLFSSHTISDYMKGRFTQHPLTGEVLFRYTINPIITTDIYDMGYTLGKKYAGYLTDYFLNLHIARELPEGTYPDSWYHLDVETGKLIRGWVDYFTELTPQQ